MVREVKRVHMTAGSELASLAEEVRAENEVRILERDGEQIAAIVPLTHESLAILRRPTRQDIERALSAIGAWKDLDTEELKERIYRNRHESPPSPPVDW
jgi:hypothetical protein